VVAGVAAPCVDSDYQVLNALPVSPKLAQRVGDQVVFHVYLVAARRKNYQIYFPNEKSQPFRAGLWLEVALKRRLCSVPEEPIGPQPREPAHLLRRI